MLKNLSRWYVPYQLLSYVKDLTCIGIRPQVTTSKPDLPFESMQQTRPFHQDSEGLLKGKIMRRGPVSDLAAGKYVGAERRAQEALGWARNYAGKR